MEQFEIINGKCTIPVGVETIEPEMFRGNTALVEIIIPSTVHFIGMHAFDGCTSLKDITIDTKNTKFSPFNTFRGCPNAKRKGLYDDLFESLATRIKTVEKKIKDTQ